jgi:hypothetical protein
MVPVDTAHVGCVTVTSATAGVEGMALIVIDAVVDVQFVAFFTVTV